MRAQDIMTTDIVTVSPTTPVDEIARLLVAHGISAVPVRDGRKLVGIASEGDLLRRVELETEPRRARWLEMLMSTAALAQDYVRSHGRKAADVMTRDPITVPPGASLAEIVATMEKHGVKRVLVTEDGELMGLITRRSLIQALATPRHPAGEDREDTAIRAAILQEIARQPWAGVLHHNVIVKGGVAHLWGMVGSESERDAIRVVAEQTPGVARVEDHLVAQQTFGLPTA